MNGRKVRVVGTPGEVNGVATPTLNNDVKACMSEGDVVSCDTRSRCDIIPDNSVGYDDVTRDVQVVVKDDVRCEERISNDFIVRSVSIDVVSVDEGVIVTPRRIVCGDLDNSVESGLKLTEGANVDSNVSGEGGLSVTLLHESVEDKHSPFKVTTSPPRRTGGLVNERVAGKDNVDLVPSLDDTPDKECRVSLPDKECRVSLPDKEFRVSLSPVNQDVTSSDTAPPVSSRSCAEVTPPPLSGSLVVTSRPSDLTPAPAALVYPESDVASHPSSEEVCV